MRTVESDSFFDDSLPDFFLASEFLIEILEVLLGDHLANRDEKFPEFLHIEYAVVVAIEQQEVLLILLLFLNGDVLLDLLLGISLVLIDGPQLGNLPVSWHLGQIISQVDSLPCRTLRHQLQMIICRNQMRLKLGDFRS